MESTFPETRRDGDDPRWPRDVTWLAHLVLFYETFSTSHSYTRIGKVDDVAGLAAAMGAGSVRVTFAL